MYSTKIPENSVARYYVYCDDEVVEEFKSSSKAIAYARNLNRDYAGVIEVERHIWYSLDSYNSYEPSDEVDVIWTNQ